MCEADVTQQQHILSIASYIIVYYIAILTTTTVSSFPASQALQYGWQQHVTHVT